MSDCIIFAVPKNAQGYGRVYIRGKGSQKKFSAHRIAYANAHGLDVETMGGVVMHSCDNPSCINPCHLTLGTHQDNMTDMADKGRSTKGEAHWCSKLTPSQAEEIRRRHVPRCKVNGSSALAREYGVSHTTICQTVRNKRWTANPETIH